MIKSPCKNCEDRHLGCHSECGKYIMFKMKYNYEAAVIKKKKHEECLLYYK